MDTPLEFSKCITDRYEDGSVLTFHKIEFDDRLILNIQIEGIMDTTFKVPMSTKAFINSYVSEDADNDLGIEPQIIVGDHQNVKMTIITTQIGKAVQLSKRPKEVILSIGSRWFGKGDEVSEDDFPKLVFILENIKKVL